MDDLNSLPHVPENDSKRRVPEPFTKVRPFIRHLFSFIMNWDIHYFLPIATTWVSTGATNWVTRLYLRTPF